MCYISHNYFFLKSKLSCPKTKITDLLLFYKIKTTCNKTLILLVFNISKYNIELIKLLNTTFSIEIKITVLLNKMYLIYCILKYFLTNKKYLIIEIKIKQTHLARIHMLPKLSKVKKGEYIIN